MKKELLFIFFLFSTKIFAQDLPVKISLGVQQNNFSKDVPMPRQVVYSDENGFLEVTYADHKYFLQRISPDFQVEKTVQIEVPVNHVELTSNGFANGCCFSGGLFSNQKICLFWTIVDKKEKRFSLFYNSFEPSNCEPVQKMTEITSSVSSYQWIRPMNLEAYDFFKIAQSPNRRFLSIVYQSELVHKRDSTCEKILVLDSAFKTIWNSKHDYPISAGNFNIRQSLTDNSGNVIYSAIQIYERPIYDFGKDDFPFRSEIPYVHFHGNFHLTSVTQNGTFFCDKIIELDDKDKKITDINISQNETGVYVLGFWLNEYSYVQSQSCVETIGSNGVFFSIYDRVNLTAQLSTSVPYPEKIIKEGNNFATTQKVNVKRDKSNSNCVYGLVPQKTEIVDDDNILLFSEQLSSYMREYGYLHFKGMIAMFRFDHSGQLKSTSVIPKYEYENDVPMYEFVENYIVFRKDNVVNVIFSKSSINNTRSTDPKESSIDLAEINESGEVKVTVLKEMKGDSFYKLYLGWSFSDVKNSRILLYGIENKGKKFRPLLISY